ncbi:MAG: hypothetical protein IKK13_06175 [Clostridia bacterium]|nr:hypothetical protein [Clostridia bacterium]
MKLDATVKRETKFIALFTAVLSLLMQSVFLIIGKWDYTVLLGNLLGYSAGLGNFVLLGITVQNAVTKSEDDAKKLIKLSQQLRLFGMLGIALIGYLVPVFHIIAVIIPFLFPRIAIALRSALIKDKD